MNEPSNKYNTDQPQPRGYFAIIKDRIFPVAPIPKAIVKSTKQEGDRT